MSRGGTRGDVGDGGRVDFLVFLLRVRMAIGGVLLAEGPAFWVAALDEPSFEKLALGALGVVGESESLSEYIPMQKGM